MTAFERVVGLLDNVKVQRPGDVLASCPLPKHGLGRGDKNPSLHVTDAGGRVLIDCKTGVCHPQDILLALGLDYPDLFDDNDERGSLVATYTYQRPDGTPLHVNERWQTKTGKRFVQRLVDAEKPGLHGTLPSLYHLPQLLAAAKAGQRVYWVEGEKCVHAAEKIGLVATCCTGGVNGWHDYYPRAFAGASEVVVITDNDEPGKVFAAQVVAAMRSAGLKSRSMGVKVETAKADLYDHVKAGYGEADLVPLNLNRLRPQGAVIAEVVNTDYPPVRWAIPGLISAGLTVLGGAPKIGKSWITLDMALGVACGGRALHSLQCERGDVLMLTLDNDTMRRVKERTLYLFGGVMPDEMADLEVHCEWPTGLAALAAVQEWANEADHPLMVIADTLQRIEPEFEGNGRENAYGASVNVLSRWAKFGQETGISVVAVHHDKKGEEDDWVNRFTGSRGITAAAQTLLMLNAKRGENTGTMHVVGRDIETEDLELRRTGRSWIAMESPRGAQEAPPQPPTLHVVQ